jgi:nitrate reductase delta subunit
MMARPLAPKTFKALSALLTYPTGELVAAMQEIEEAVATEDVLKADVQERLRSLFIALSTLDLYDLQECYVELFDRSRRLSLNLFEHIHGEGRDRGQAMVDLAAHYEQGGLILTANELPDYLPLFLEFLSTKPIDEACGLLAETATILALLEERLGKRGSPYAAVLAAIGSLAGKATIPANLSDAADEPDDLAALDAAWEETAVSFGPGNGTDGCSVDRLKIQIRAARRDARNNAV